jgi:hypothetical protein
MVHVKNYAFSNFQLQLRNGTYPKKEDSAFDPLTEKKSTVTQKIFSYSQVKVNLDLFEYFIGKV